MKMKITHDGPFQPGVEVVLSRRNLLALLAKLDDYPTQSTCTILGGDDAFGLTLRVEDDAVHYADRQAGAMHPDTEAEIARKQT